MHAFSSVSEYYDHFAIDNTTAVVTMVKSMDRESSNSVSLLVKASQVDDEEKFDVCLLVVEIDDVNDNRPIATLESFHVTLDENSAPGTYVTRITATDPDAATEFEYFLIPNDTISIKQITGEIVVANNSRLDAEKFGQMTFQVYVKERNTLEHQISEMQILTVSIRDVNDHSPKFTVKTVSIVVKENATSGGVITKLNATDKDRDERNNVITFSIHGGEGLFDVSDLGQVILVGDPDAELSQSHNLLVVASDPQERRDFCLVEVTVDDVNDNAPVFEKSLYKAKVSRLALPGTTVMALHAIDPDISSKLSYKLIDEDSNGLLPFEVVDEGVWVEIRTRDVLSTDLRNEHIFRVEASDGEKATAVQVRVTVVEPRVSSPRFNATQFYFDIDENLPPNSTVGTVQAFDPGYNDSILYEFCRDESHFQLDQTSGTIYTTKSLDRENMTSHSLCIFAQVGSPSRGYQYSRPAYVRVTVRDLNDNAPKFIRSNWLDRWHVMEETNGDAVVVLKTSDQDSLKTNITFYLADDFSGTFSLGLRTGILRVSRRIDLDKPDEPLSYNLSVKAVDVTNHNLFDEAQITVVIDDVNDNLPEFTQSVFVVEIPEDKSVDSVVFTLNATDADRSPENKIAFFHMESEYFSVDQYTGEILLQRKLNYDQPEVHRELNATIWLTDIFTSSYSKNTSIVTSTATVTFLVRDVNDNAPIFRHVTAYTESGVNMTSQDREPVTLYTLEIPEATPVGNLGVKVSAEDEDSEANDVLMVGDDGFLILLRPLDYESDTSDLWIEVVATDMGSPTYTSKTLILLRVVNTNDNPPDCNHTEFNFSVRADRRDNPTYIGLLACSDLDGDELSYNVANHGTGHTRVNDFGEFLYSGKASIDPSSGLLAVSNYTDLGQMRFICVVSDGRHSTNVTVNVEISPNNDPTRFSKNLYDVTVPEDLPPRGVVAKLETTERGLIKPRNASSLFEIESSAGELRLKAGESLDYEATTAYNLLLELLSGNETTSTAFVRIEVTDVNDNSPRFLKNVYEVALEENTSSAGQHVLQVSAEDLDVNDVITYSIDTKLLKIDQTSGEVTSMEPFDREERSSYNFTVWASDGIHNDSATLRVTITDLNDNAPKFDRRNVSLEVVESDLPRVIFTASAIDDDMGTNGISWYRLRQSMELFRIDWLSGQLFMRDGAALPAYDVTIEVRDLANTLSTQPTMGAADDVMVLHVTLPELVPVDRANPVEITTQPFTATYPSFTISNTEAPNDSTQNLLTTPRFSSNFTTTPLPETTHIYRNDVNKSTTFSTHGESTTIDVTTIALTTTQQTHTSKPALTASSTMSLTTTATKATVAASTAPPTSYKKNLDSTTFPLESTTAPAIVAVSKRDYESTVGISTVGLKGVTDKTTLPVWSITAPYTTFPSATTRRHDTATHTIRAENMGTKFTHHAYHVDIEKMIAPNNVVLVMEVTNQRPDAVFSIVTSTEDLFGFKSFRSSELLTKGYLREKASYKILVQVENLCSPGEIDKATVIINTSYPTISRKRNSIDLSFSLLQPVEHLIVANFFHPISSITNVQVKNLPRSTSTFPIRVQLVGPSQTGLNLYVHIPQKRHIFYANHYASKGLPLTHAANLFNACLGKAGRKLEVKVLNSSVASGILTLYGVNEQHEILTGQVVVGILKDNCAGLLNSTGITAFSLSELSDVRKTEENTLYLVIPLVIVSSCLFISVTTAICYLVYKRAKKSAENDSLKTNLTPKQPTCLFLDNSLQRHTNTDSDLDDSSSTISRPVPKRIKRHFETANCQRGKSDRTSPVERKLEHRTCIPAMRTFKQAPKRRCKLPTEASPNTCQLEGQVLANQTVVNTCNQVKGDATPHDCSVNKSNGISDFSSKEILTDRPPTYEPAPVTNVDSIFVDCDIEALTLPERSTPF